MCGVCRKQFAAYRCPKCQLPYCSLVCYRGDAHLECSEHFYRDEVVASLNSQQASPEERQKMQAILARLNETEQPHPESFFDKPDSARQAPFGSSELDPNNPALPAEPSSTEPSAGDLIDELQRLVGNADDLDLDDPAVCEQLWQAMTPQHRELFQEQVQNGLLAAELPLWQPWWTHVPETLQSFQLIQDTAQQLLDIVVVPSTKQTLREMAAASELKPMAEILKGKYPAPQLIYNMLNVVLAYAHSLRLYNGDTSSHMLDVAQTMLQSSVVLSNATAVCNSAAEALTHFSLSIQDAAATATQEEHVRVLAVCCDDATLLLRHPCAVLAALLHALALLRTATTPSARRETGRALAMQLQRAVRKLWFLCCWWMEAVTKVEQGKGLAFVKRVLTSLADAVVQARQREYSTNSDSSGGSGDGVDVGADIGIGHQQDPTKTRSSTQSSTQGSTQHTEAKAATAESTTKQCEDKGGEQCDSAAIADTAQRPSFDAPEPAATDGTRVPASLVQQLRSLTVNASPECSNARQQRQRQPLIREL